MNKTIKHKGMKKNTVLSLLASLFALAIAFSCSSDDPKPGAEGYPNGLQNDCIKRSLGPNVAGLKIDFVYAIALPYGAGRITSASVSASIPGAEGTFLEHRSFHTDAGGADAFVTVGNPCTTAAGKTEVTFSADTCAASLRYSYLIPENAKGKQVDFTFSATASNGQSVSYRMGPYSISVMDMALNLVATSDANCFISLSELKVLTAEEAAANPAKVDLIYLYRSNINSFAHAIVAPAAEPSFRPGLNLPAGVGNNTLIRRVYQVRDKHLSGLQYGVYVDDPDFPALDFTNMPNFSLNLVNEYGLFAETQDKRYRAYIYINAVNPGTANSGIPASSIRISIKRMTM
jgi:hypothetical protein